MHTKFMNYKFCRVSNTENLFPTLFVVQCYFFMKKHFLMLLNSNEMVVLRSLFAVQKHVSFFERKANRILCSLKNTWLKNINYSFLTVWENIVNNIDFKKTIPCTVSVIGSKIHSWILNIRDCFVQLSAINI